MKKQHTLRRENIEQTVYLLKEINSHLENMVVTIDRIGTRFDSYELTAKVLLDYFNEDHVLDKLSYLRKISFTMLEQHLTDEELDEYLEDLANTGKWEIPCVGND